MGREEELFYDRYVFIYAREMSAKTMAAGRMGGEDKYYWVVTGSKGKIIEKLTVSAPLSALDEELITEFSALIKAHPGNAELYFHVMDEDGQMYVNLMSRTMKISVQKEIMTYLKSQPQLSYKIN